jgi:hypothetical protein
MVILSNTYNFIQQNNIDSGLPQTPEQYYSNEDNFGSYQYTNLKDIIDSMLLEAQDDDSFLKNTPRSKLIRHAKQAIREVTRQVANDVIAIEVTVPGSLCWPMPQDYVNYARVSVVEYDSVTGSLRLQPLDVNYKINTAIGYLQDNNADIIFDEDGLIITADSSNGYAKPYKKYNFSTEYQPTLNTSKLSQFGEFTPDERRGMFLFSSDLSDREIVIEYVSDGLQAGFLDEEITVHKYLRDTIENWVYFSCIERRRNVPQNEKDRALRRYKTTLHQAKMALANFDLLRIARTLRANTMTL